MTKSRPLLLVLLPLAALAGVAALWLLLDGSGSTAPAPAAAGVAVAATPTAPASAPEGLPPTVEDEPVDTPDERASVSGEDEFELANATWIDGHIVFPHDTPLDEQVRVFALILSHDSEMAMQSFRELRSLGGKHLREWREFECDVAADGTFRAPFDAEQQAWLWVEGRYVYLDQPLPVDLATGSAVIEPELGACVVGRFLLPAGAERHPELEPFEVTVRGWGVNAGGRYGDSTEVGEELSFEFGGVPTELNYILTADPLVYVAVGDSRLEVEPGKRLERTYTLRVGVAVSGVVRDESGAAVAGAKVQGHAPYAWFGTPLERKTTTDDAGRFELRAIKPGGVRLTAEHDGYAQAETEERKLADGDVWTDAELILARGGRVTGTVTWPDGTPATASVAVIESTERDRLNDWQTHRDHAARCDTAGRFEVTGLGQGTFVVRAGFGEDERAELAENDPRRTDPGTWRAVADDVLPGADVALVLAAPVSISGTVLDDLGRPVTRFEVTVAEQRESGGGQHFSKTLSFEDEDGAFLIEELAVGEWKVTADAEGHAPSEPALVRLPGAPAANGPLDLRIARSASVAGTVLDPHGAALEGAQVIAGRGLERARRTSEPVLTDAEGNFVLAELDPGAIELVATHDDWAQAPAEAVDTQPGAALTGVVLHTARGGLLTGEVFDSTGAPDAGRQVMVQAMSRQGRMGGTAHTDEGGRFELDHIAAGTYQVVALPDYDKLDEGDQAAIMKELRMTSVEVVDGETVHVVLGAPPADPVLLRGRVTQAGEPRSGATVMALAEGGAMLEKMELTETEADGSYEMTLDEPGDYTLMVGEQMGDDQACEFQVTIPKVAEHRLDLELPSARIVGTVFGPSGTPLAGVTITYEDEDGSSPFSIGGLRNVQTNTEGGYELMNLRAGRYTVRAGSLGFGNTSASYGIHVRGGITLVEGETARVDLELSRPGSIAGVARDADGRGVGGASVFVRAVDGELLNPFSTTTTDAGGRFEFSGCAPGQYTVCARLDLRASPETGPVGVVEGEQTELELTLSSGTILRVVIEDGEGLPARAKVRVFDEAGREVGSMLGTESMQTLFTEGFSSTEHRAGPLPSGKYRVEATAAEGSAKKSVTLRGQDERKLKLRLK
jgi:hypothetical protein